MRARAGLAAALLAACGGDAAEPPAGTPAQDRAAAPDASAPRRTEEASERAAAPAAGAYTVLRRVSIVDRQGFGQPVEALSLLVPREWSCEGGVEWVSDLGCPATGIRLTLRAASPDGRTGAELFPAYVWTWSDDPSLAQIMRQQPRTMRCDLGPPVPARQWLAETLVPGVRPGARVVAAEELPEVARALDAQVALELGAAGGSGGLDVRHDVARLRLRREDAGGALEEWLVGSLQHSFASMPSTSAMLGYGGPQTTTSSTSAAFDLYALWAPAGELDRDEKLFASIVASARPNPVWTAAVQQHLAAMARIAQKGALDRSRILAEANEYVANLRQETWEARQRSQDAMAEAFSQTIRGVETYVDPLRGGEVELPSGYRDVWTNGNGEYLLSEVAGWDPNAALTSSSWTQIHERP